MLPLSPNLNSIVNKLHCCGINQVLVDGISKSALEAAVELVYTGAHLVGRHGVSVEEVVEAGVALGLPFSAENIYTDSERTIFEVTPVEPSLHLRPLEHSSEESKALEPQSNPVPYIGDAVKQLVTDHVGNSMIAAGVQGRNESEEAGIEGNHAGQMPQDTSRVSLLLEQKHSSSERIPLQCHLCTFSTLLPSFLRLHVNRVHKQGSPPALICPHCGKGAAGIRGLQIHIAHTHKIYRSGKGKNRQHAQNQLQHQDAPSQQQFDAPALSEQVMKPPHPVVKQVKHKSPPQQHVGNKHAKRSKSVGSYTRRSSTTKRIFHRKSSDSCDFPSSVQEKLSA